MIKLVFLTYTAYLRSDSKEIRLFLWDHIVYSLRTFLEPLMLFILWGAAASISETTSINTVGLYFIAYALVARLTLTWIGDDLRRIIQKGELFSKLLKPLPGGFLAERVLHEMSLRWARAKVTFIIAAIIYLVVAQFISLPFAPLSQLVFLPLAIIGGTMINFCFWLIISCTAFWWYENTALTDLVDTILPFLDGTFIPLIFFPDAISSVLKWLPFRYNVSFPLEIMSQSMSWSELITGTLIMISWCLILLVLSRIVWRKGLKVYQG